MNILHTSDWHLGRTLYGRRRYAEFEAFLTWLGDTLQAQAIDVLLVAGDIFDTQTPSNRAQTLYYRFLCRVAASPCRHVVVIGGNHDSPTFLNAPKELLKSLNVHVVGSISDRLDDEVMVLEDAQGAPELIVCAVPYLRDRDIRTAEAGESVEDKGRKLIEGVRDHYAAVAQLAEQRRKELHVDVPIVAMGHLFTAGGKIQEGDGVRELYVGSLAHVAATIFPTSFDYVALGHLHVPQTVAGAEHIRYSGSPLPMGFGEAKQQKSVCLVQLDRTGLNVELLPIPVFQALERIQGDWSAIEQRLQALSAAQVQAWLEIEYTGDTLMSDLREQLDALVAGTSLDILRLKNSRMVERVLQQNHSTEALDDLDEHEVFARCLAAHAVPDTQHSELVRTYQEALATLFDADPQA